MTTLEQIEQLLRDQEMLIEHNAILINGMNCAIRLIELVERDDITMERKIKAVNEVLHVARERARGLPEASVSKETMLLLGVVLADVEVRILYDKLGIKTWRPV